MENCEWMDIDGFVYVYYIDALCYVPVFFTNFAIVATFYHKNIISNTNAPYLPTCR